MAEATTAAPRGLELPRVGALCLPRPLPRRVVLGTPQRHAVLDRLAEVQLYFSKGIIDETLKVDAFGAIAGPDGQVLATGTDDEKRPILDKIIKRDYE